MEIKKSIKASLENKKLLFTEIGLVVALLLVWGAFERSSKDVNVSALEADASAVEIEDMVPITESTPPPPEAAPKIPVLSDEIEIVEDDIKVEDMFQTLEDDANTGVEIMVLFWGIVIDEEFMVPAITNRIGYDFGCRVI